MIDKKVELFGLEFDALTMHETVELVNQKIIAKTGAHLLGVNADKINELGLGEPFRSIIEQAEIINADGASIVLASKLLNRPLPERIAGIDLMQELIGLAEQKNYRVFFLGAREENLNKMVQRLTIKYPQLCIAGSRNGYFSEDKWVEIAENLKYLQPEIVFIGITSPKKEYLIQFLLNQGIQSVFMGVGGSFDVLSGTVKRAPLWMQKCNLEWLFRVKQEPKRLFKRYFFGNVLFGIKLLKEIVQK
ncbi:N-acetylglucosaminyldiphosphoundecaprenol N-acetyl-beta-D-mannosaminyltransferase [Enterococcus sp. AZ194]|uniref:WecB/TagA/CpsF family glycosyltransferase n=1 Tax=Enterococcus sp. AZ194 TaxID=2774629 RepID=UPI003F2245EC